MNKEHLGTSSKLLVLKYTFQRLRNMHHRLWPQQTSTDHPLLNSQQLLVPQNTFEFLCLLKEIYSKKRDIYFGILEWLFK